MPQFKLKGPRLSLVFCKGESGMGCEGSVGTRVVKAIWGRRSGAGRRTATHSDPPHGLHSVLPIPDSRYLIPAATAAPSFPRDRAPRAGFPAGGSFVPRRAA